MSGITVRTRPDDQALEKMTITLSIGMSLDDWRKLHGRLNPSTWPDRVLADQISAALDKLVSNLSVYVRSEVSP